MEPPPQSGEHMGPKDEYPPGVGPGQKQQLTQPNPKKKIKVAIIVTVIVILVACAIAIPLALTLNGDDQSQNELIDEEQPQNQLQREDQEQDQSTDQTPYEQEQQQTQDEPNNQEQPQDQQDQTQDEPIDEQQPQVEQDPIQYCELNPSQCQGVNPQTQQSILSAYDDQDQVAAVIQMVGEISNLHTIQETEDSNIQAYNDQFRTYECMSYIFQGQQLREQYTKWIEQVLDTEQKWERYFRMVGDFGTQAIEPTNNMEEVCKFNVTSTTRRRFLQQSNRKRLLQQILSTQCYDVGTTIMFINGVGYTPDGAFENIMALKRLVDGEYPNFTLQQLKDFGGLVNPELIQYTYESQGIRNTNFYLDIWQVFIQKRRQNNQTVIDMLTSWRTIRRLVLAFLSFHPALSIGTRVTASFINFFIEKMMKNAQMNIATNNRYHLKKITALLERGRKVILVAHSQGTLYVNEAHRHLNLTQRKSVGLVFVGGAASSIFHRPTQERIYYGGWIRNPQDYVINKLEQWTDPPPLPSNVGGIQFACTDFFCPNHGFVGYITNYPNQIFTMIYHAVSFTDIPSEKINFQSAISVDLVWEYQPEYNVSSSASSVYLHVIEPDGQTVNRFNSVGTYGVFLFVKSENTEIISDFQGYDVPCFNLERGNFVFITDFSGNTPVSCQLSIKVGSERKVIDFKLGSEGQNSNAVVIGVTVNEQNNKFVYSLMTDD